MGHYYICLITVGLILKLAFITWKTKQPIRSCWEPYERRDSCGTGFFVRTKRRPQWHSRPTALAPFSTTPERRAKLRESENHKNKLAGVACFDHKRSGH